MPRRSPNVRVYVKRQLRLDRLTFTQKQMYNLGITGLANVKERVQSGLGPDDTPAKPLSKRYAIYKSKRLRKRAVRDLTLTGSMMKNLLVRTVSENRAKAALTSRKERTKGKILGEIQTWLVFSPNNVRKSLQNAKAIFRESVKRLPVTKWLEG